MITPVFGSESMQSRSKGSHAASGRRLMRGGAYITLLTSSYLPPARRHAGRSLAMTVRLTRKSARDACTGVPMGGTGVEGLGTGILSVRVLGPPVSVIFASITPSVSNLSLAALAALMSDPYKANAEPG